jgi:NAD(P)-dependent dehydrogenase (short-subunit alcohol dehydrogenase family)
MTPVVLVTGANRGLGHELARQLALRGDASSSPPVISTRPSGPQPPCQASTADLQVVREALEVNLLGAWQTALTLLPLLRRSGHGRIVNVSSEAGSLATMDGGTRPTPSPKAALNALTRLLAGELGRDRILVNAVCPGWVATDMGGPGGRPVAEGAASVLWAIDLPDDGPTGGFYRDGRPIPW